MQFRLCLCLLQKLFGPRCEWEIDHLLKLTRPPNRKFPFALTSTPRAIRSSFEPLRSPAWTRKCQPRCVLCARVCKRWRLASSQGKPSGSMSITSKPEAVPVGTPTRGQEGFRFNPLRCCWPSFNEWPLIGGTRKDRKVSKAGDDHGACAPFRSLSNSQGKCSSGWWYWSYWGWIN